MASPKDIDPGRAGGHFHLRTGLVLSIIQGLGLVLVVAQESLSARMFGARSEMDGYLEAWIVPVTLATILGSGIQNALIPHFAHKRSAEGPEAAWQLAGEAISSALLLFSLLAVLGLGAGPWVLQFTNASGTDAARAVSREVYPLGFLFAGTTLSAGILSSVCASAGRFLLPTVLGSLTTLFPVAFLILFTHRLGILVLPIGLLVGSTLYAGTLLWALHALGLRLRLPSRGALGRLLPVARDGLAIAISSVLLGAIPITERHLASSLGEGAVSHLAYAGKLVSAAMRFLGAGMGVMGLSLLSAYLARGETERFQRAFSLMLRLSLYLATAAVLGLALAGRPIVQLLFQRGRFEASDTIMVSRLLIWYCLCLFYGIAMPGFNAALLAQKRAWALPVMNTLGFLAYLLIAWLGGRLAGNRVTGLAAAFGLCFNLILVTAGFWLSSAKLVPAAEFYRAAGRALLLVPLVGGPVFAVKVLLDSHGSGPLELALVLGAVGVASMLGAVGWIDREVFHRVFDAVFRRRRPTAIPPIAEGAARV